MLDPTILTAVITTAGSTAVAVTALVLNHGGFTTMNSRLSSIEARLNTIEARFDHRLELIETDLKNFYKTQTDQALDIARLKDKTR